MKKSAGLVIIYKGMILLCHPTNSSWKGTYSIPKGEIEFGERPIDAALRETEEEVGLHIKEDWVDPTPNVVEYKNKQGRTYKKVIWFKVDMSAEHKPSNRIPTDLLQKKEVDWAGFLTKEEAEDRIFHRFKHFLELI